MRKSVILLNLLKDSRTKLNKRDIQHNKKNNLVRISYNNKKLGFIVKNCLINKFLHKKAIRSHL